MNARRIALAALALVAPFTLGAGTPASAASLGGGETGVQTTALVLTVTSEGPLYRLINQCPDSEPVYVSREGVVFGDADGDGTLTGAECSWW